jgi:hypothetical protein
MPCSQSLSCAPRKPHSKELGHGKDRHKRTAKQSNYSRQWRKTAHDKEQCMTMDQDSARQRIRAYDRAHNARQRLGRTTNPLPCNVGEAHDKETVAVNGTAMRPLPCKSSCFLVVSFPSLGASRSSPLPSESQIVKSTKLLRS